MATVKPWTAFSWAAVCVLAVATAAGAAPPVGPGAAQEAGPAPDQPDDAHAALNNAIECYRRGDFERASGLLLQAQVS